MTSPTTPCWVYCWKGAWSGEECVSRTPSTGRSLSQRRLYLLPLLSQQSPRPLHCRLATTTSSPTTERIIMRHVVSLTLLLMNTRKLNSYRVASGLTPIKLEPARCQGVCWALNFSSPRLRAAALTLEVLGQSWDNNKHLFVTPYLDVILILPGGLSACVVQYFI